MLNKTRACPLSFGILAGATAGLLLFSTSAWSQTGSACDLNGDTSINVIDVQLSVNMTLGLAPCAANVYGTNVCNVVVVQRVTNAALGGACVTGPSAPVHSVDLTWTPSTSTNVVGYYIYRGTTSNGPYAKLNSTPFIGSAYTDNGVQAGQTYYYVATAVDDNGAESGYSNQAMAVIPTP